jgi:hypothetical protein
MFSGEYALSVLEEFLALRHQREVPVKKFLVAAKAALLLQRYEEARQICLEGLQYYENNPLLLEFMKKIQHFPPCK